MRVRARVRVKGVEGLGGGDLALDLEQGGDQLVALREQRLGRVAVGGVRKVERRGSAHRRVALEALRPGGALEGQLQLGCAQRRQRGPRAAAVERRCLERRRELLERVGVCGQ